MAGLADIRIVPVKDDAEPVDTPREIVIPASIDKYRKPAEAKPEKKGVSLSDFMPSFTKGDKSAPPSEPQELQGVTSDPMGGGLGAQIMSVATPTRTSVLEGQQIPVLPFDSQEAERLSNRAYAEATPAPGDLNDPRLRAPSLSQANPRPEDPNTAKGLAYADSSFPVRVGAKAVAGIAEGVGGVMRSAGDIAGIDALKAAGRSTADGAKAFEQGMGDIKRVDGFGPKSPVPYLANMAEGAASSLAQTAALGSMFGAHAVIPLMSIQSAGSQYNSARNAGKTPAEALANAIPYGAFEAIGEKFTGLDRVAGAMGTLLQKGATADAKKTAAETLIKSGIKEVPGEIITYLGQTGVDLLPGIGLNPNLTMGQFIDGLRDTVVQASMMGGAMGVGGAAVQRKQREAAELAGMNATIRAIAPDIGLPDKALAAVLEKTKGMDPDKVPGFLDRFTQSLATKGMLKPHAPGTVDKALRDARHQATTAIDALQAKPPVDEAVPASEVLGAVEPETAETGPVTTNNAANNDIPANQVLEAAAHEAATSPLNDRPEPTDAQKAAGNYAMGHTRIGGMGVTIENPAGSTRKGTSEDGKPWESHMHDHYGYFKRTEGADGDKLDGFFKIGTPEDFSGNVYVVDQIDPKTGKFDEHKVVVGANDEADAQATYLRNYEPGWQGMGAMTAMPMDQFKNWVKDGVKDKPLAKLKGAQDVGTGAQANPVDSGSGGQLGDNAAGGDTVRGRVADNAGQRGTDAAGTVLANGQQDVPLRTGEPEPAPALKIGTTPKNAEEVSIKGGVVHIGKYPAVDFESGEPVQLAEGASHAQIRDALKAAKALGAHQKLFGLVDDVQNAAPGTTAAQTQAAQVEAPAPAAGSAQPDMGNPISPAGAGPNVEAAGLKKPGPGGSLMPVKADLKTAKGLEVTLQREFSGKYNATIGGEPAGSVVYTDTPSGGFRVTGIDVDPKFRRKGVASAIYDFLEKDVTGQPLTESGGQSEDGIAFRRARASKVETTGVTQDNNSVKTATPVGSKTATPARGSHLRTAANDKNPLIAFIAQHGLFHEKGKPNSLKAEFSPDKAIMVPGYPPVFRKTGQNLDLLTHRAIEDGFLPKDGTEQQLYGLIQRAIGGERIAPLHAEGVADDVGQKEMEARLKLEEEDWDTLRAQDAQWTEEFDDERAAIEAESALTDAEFIALADAVPWGVNSNADTRTFLQALGATEKEIQDAIAKEQGKQTKGAGRRARTEKTPASQAPGDHGQRGQAPGDSPRNTEAVATPQTPADAGVSVSGVSIEPRADGTLAVSGPVAEIKAKLKAAGIPDKSVMPGKGNVIVGKTQADKAKAALQPTQDAAPVLQAPTPAEVIAQQDLKDNAQALDDKAQIDKEAKPAVAANTVFTEDAATAARAMLKKKLGTLNSGIDPELLQAGITLAGYHIEKGARTFAAYAKAMLDDMGDSVKPYLKSFYMAVKFDPRASAFDGMDSAASVESANVDNLPKESPDVPSTPTRVERNSPVTTAEPAVGEPVPAEPGRLDQGTGQAGKDLGAEGRGRDGDTGISVDSAVAGGERGGVFVHRGNEPVGSQSVDAGDMFGERGGDTGNDGIQADPIPASTVDQAAQAGPGRSLQPSSVKVSPGLESIQATVPQLLPPQQEDVHKAETRFAKPTGYGMLFTNGTGTGKTFSGLGIVKRFALQGKTNTLITVPDDKIAADWIKSGRALGLDITKLADTKSSGTGIVITSYANLGANDELAKRNWDLVVADEAHSLMQAADGEVTIYLSNLRAITHHPDGVHQLHRMRNRDDLEKAREISDQITQNEKIRNHDDTMDVMRDSLAVENDALNKRLSALRKKLDARLDADKAEVASMQNEKRARAVFLSATPFAYEKTIDWANGYLFDYNEGYPYTETSLGYNDPTPREHFFMQHLGYRKRYGKLTEPEGAKVDRGLMQRQLNGWLKKEGSLSGRMLDVPADYDRRFVLVDSAIGNQIDEALQWLSDQSRAAPKEDGGYGALRAAIEDKFDYLSRRYLLEAIKATEAVPIVKAHMAMGRKVVVFHDYNQGGGFNPFSVQPSPPKDGQDEFSATRAAQFNAALTAFRAKFTDLVNHPFHQMGSPIDVFNKAFDDVLLINGLEKKKDLLARYDTFQDDASGPKVMLVQSNKNKGWSGHDTTGKHQRVLINLGQPTAPTLAIQQEGRIYRTGQVSNAIMRYLNTGTNWEKWAFASTIAGRASTAENLGMGELSRALKDSFIASFEESDAYPPGHEGEGTGGKERDKANNAVITEWDRAKTFYWATGKKTSKTKAQEGTDYFATPEPVGLKMVEWLDLRGGEDAMEPSGGHGAIARWLPETTTRTVIEPSMALRSRLAMVMNDGDYKILDGTFENHNIVNKYDGIAMNPPFGVGGKTAMEHVAKAATHLRDGGRIVALIPTGPAADKRWEKWFYETDERAASPLYVDPNHGPIFKGDTLTLTGFGTLRKIVVDKVDGTGLAKYVRDANTPPNGAVNITAINKVEKTGKRAEEYKPAADLYLVADIKLPQVTFERAGTAVATRIVVLEKHAKESEATQRTAARMDLSNAADINELFDRLENVALPTRPKAEVVAEPSKSEKPAKTIKQKAEVGSTITIDGKQYEISIFTTMAGKEKRGVWMKSKAEAQKYSARAFTSNAPKDAAHKGEWFVDEYWFPKTGTSDFDSSVAARDGDLLAQYTPEEAKAKQEREAQALKEEQAKPKAPPARRVTADQVDLFNPQGALFARAPQVDSPKFKAWFGDSKVVDADGKPLVVYHGTTYSDIDSFKPQGPDGDKVLNLWREAKANNGRFGYMNFRGGSFFSPHPEYAGNYTHENTGVMYPVYIKAENPIYFDQVTGKVSGVDPNKTPDALFMMDGDIINEIAVIDPTQIKSAIGNNGNFDPKNPDIRQARQPSSTGMSVKDARAVVDALTEKWDNAPEVRVVESFKDLPVDATPDTRGLYSRGTVWIVANANKDAFMVAKTYAHEAIAHHGLRSILGRNDWDKFMRQIQLAIASGNKPMNDISQDIRRVYVDENGRFNLSEGIEADEIAARVVENAIDQVTGHFRPGFGFVKEVYAKLAKWLREVVGVDVPFTVAELQGMLVAAQSGLKTGNRTAGGGQMVVAAAREDAQAARGTNAPVTNQKDVVGNQGGRSADDSIPGALVVATDKTSSVAVSRLNKVLRDAGWEVEYIDIDLTAEKPKATIRVNRDDGRYLIAKVDAIGRANFETFQRERNLGMNASTRGRRPLTPLVDDTFLGRHKFEGARSMLRGMTHYLTDNASTPINLADMRSAWTGVMNAPIKQEGIALLPNEPTAPDSFGAPMAARSPGTGTLRPSTAPMDTVLRVFGGNLAARITSPAYAWLAKTIDAMTPEGLKAGVVSDYGLKEDYLDRKQDMKTAQRQHARHLGDVIDGLQNLDRQQSRVAYFWMQEHPDNKAEADMLEQLPQESRATLLALKEQIDTLGQEAVKLGMISAETIERNRMAYLHRSYKRYETEDSGKVKAARSKAIKILGDQFKGRGLRDNAGMDQIASPDWFERKTQQGKSDTSLKGQMFHRLERRALPDVSTPDMVGDNKPKLGKLREVRYWPVDEAIPRHLADWRNDGQWEARFFDKSGKVGMWRDFTLAERTGMGEIQEVRYGVAKTIMQMSRDVETARFLDWVAKTHAVADESLLPEDAEPVESASTSLMRAYRKTEWVQVPTSAIPGTQGLKRFGNLAGRWVPGPVWNDIRQISSLSDQDILSKVYAPMLRAWKISKTALSPATHMNNVMSNFIMADAHDIQAKHMTAAMRAYVTAKKNPVSKALIDAFQDNGGDSGMFNSEEISREIFEPLLKQLEDDLIQEAGRPSALMMASNVLSLLSAREFRQAAAMIGETRTAKAAGLPFKKMIQLYGKEDELFRLAAFIKAREDGMTDQQAGKFARESFLNYEINAPWIAALRKSWMPFISFTYRAAPMMAKIAADKPWKIAKWAMVAGALNALGYMMSGGDEDKEFAFMPDEKSGRVWGFGPRKLLRMPWNDANGQPVHLDIRRWIPVGDVVDMGQGHSAIPIPPPLMPGGPAVTFAEVIGNTSLFTGQDITKATDTLAERYQKAGGYLWRSFMPNLPGLPGTYSTQAIMGAGSGKTDAFGREQSLGQALASSIGLKAGSYPVDVLQSNAAAKLAGERSELIRGLKADGRALMKKGIDQEEFNDRKDATLEKLNQRTAEFEGKKRRALGLADQR